MYCTICGNIIEDTSTMCPYCNSKQVPIVTIENDSKYHGNNTNSKIQAFSNNVGRTIGKGLGIGICIGMDIGKAIVDEIVNEVNKRND